MCGIFGAVQDDLNSDLLRKQLDTLRHRGPDDSGLWQQGNVALGSRRLAIQDLSPAGHMPMQHSTEPLWIVFNGEIYNFQALRKTLENEGHRFQSRGDTEIILAAYLHWGSACLDYLNGMFAFALYDGRENTLLLARDRAGEKPLYYYQADRQICFASELKALLANPVLPRRLNLDALNAYLALSHIPGDLCIVDGVKKLPPAHALLYDCATHTSRIWRYWSLPEPLRVDSGLEPTVASHESNNSGLKPLAEADTQDYLDELESLLFESVRLRLIADVPVGIFLSGGIDSSLVTAMAAQIAPVKTYTITFPDQAQYNEAVYARRVADYFGTEHTELAAEATTSDLLPALMQYYDEPFGDSSMIPTYLVSQITRTQVTVALGGDGGDELFGGYKHYQRVLRRQRVTEQVPQPLRSIAAQGIHYMPVGMRGRNFLSGIRKGLAENMIYSARAGFFDPITRRQLLQPGLVRHTPEDYLFGLWPRQGDPVEQMTRFDFLNYLPDDILVKVDRASMAVSLETRAPWLDQHLIEFAFGRVPAQFKIHEQRLKILPRLLAQKCLPPELDLERKQGFAIPLHQWMTQDWNPLLREVLHSLDPQLFNPQYVRGLLSTSARIPDRLFVLLIFGLWQQEYAVSLA